MNCLNVTPIGSDHATLPILLDRVSAELGTLAEGVDDLQDSLSPMLLRVAQEKPQALVEIQRLDSLAQTLASLSVFMQALGRSGVGGPLLDIGPLVDALTLSDLADRLRGREILDPEDDFELF